jgi:uncharacterized protein (DUF1330 family)
VDVTESEQSKNYALANAVALENFDARFIVRADRSAVVEGTARARNTVVEFPSFQAALDCWNSQEYQAALQLRLAAATMDLVIVEGYDGPQPF